MVNYTPYMVNEPAPYAKQQQCSPKLRPFPPPVDQHPANGSFGSTAAVGHRPRECRLWHEAAICQQPDQLLLSDQAPRTDEALWRWTSGT